MNWTPWVFIFTPENCYLHNKTTFIHQNTLSFTSLISGHYHPTGEVLVQGATPFSSSNGLSASTFWPFFVSLFYVAQCVCAHEISMYASFFVLFPFLFFWDSVSVCSSCWPKTHYVIQVGLELMVFLPQTFKY
jgi:hypothetical protein